MTDLSVTLGRLQPAQPDPRRLRHVRLRAGDGGLVDFAKLGGVIPKTVTAAPRIGNTPPRTVETACGMLNAIGLDNDGLDHFLAHHLPYLRTLPTAIIGNIAGKTEDEFVAMAARVARGGAGPRRAGTEPVVPERRRRARLRHRPGGDAAHRPPLPRRLPDSRSSPS